LEALKDLEGKMMTIEATLTQMVSEEEMQKV
jgi:hypothetical protein